MGRLVSAILCYTLAMSNERIVISGNVLFGKPRIKGSRISVEQVLACLAEGWTHEKIKEEFDLEEADIQAAIDFAHQSLSRMLFFPSTKRHAEFSD
jgi:uncharacterized protein (DUF433 family)